MEHKRISEAFDQWFTPVQYTYDGKKFEWGKNIMSVGSCFSNHMSRYLGAVKMQTINNPFGIMYNPLSIANCISRIIHRNIYSGSELMQDGEYWHSLDHNGDFSHREKNVCIEKINASIISAHEGLENLSHVLITWGSASVYIFRKTGAIVANCHKIPEAQFEKRTLSLKEIVNAGKRMINALSEARPGLEIILSVSPVRHIRDGLMENSANKAKLVLAAKELSRQESNVHYFPAFEIMMDELRDYRFYAADKIHPSKEAIEWIWKSFREALFSERDLLLLERITKINQSLNHRSQGRGKQCSFEICKKDNPSNA